MFLLWLMGIVPAGWMWRNLRYSILVIFIIAAIITPTTDIMNMCIFAAPMIVLYLVSIAIALVRPSGAKKEEGSEGGRVVPVGRAAPTLSPGGAEKDIPSPARDDRDFS